MPLEVVTAEELWDFVLEAIGVSLHELVMTLCLLLVLIFKLEKLLSRPQMSLGKYYILGGHLLSIFNRFSVLRVRHNPLQSKISLIQIYLII